MSELKFLAKEVVKAVVNSLKSIADSLVCLVLKVILFVPLIICSAMLLLLLLMFLPFAKLGKVKLPDNEYLRLLVLPKGSLAEEKTDAVSDKGIFKFFWNCGRDGCLEAVFVANKDKVTSALGKYVYFGEVLGKHSQVHGELDADDFEMLTDDAAMVELFEKHRLATGHNPLEFLQEESDDV